MNTSTTVDATTNIDAAASRSMSERIEPYIAIIGPMMMILMILLFMGAVEPARYFRASNLNLILLDAALYMPMAMAMTLSLIHI